MSYCVGIDLGGTRLKTALVNMQTGDISGVLDVPTNASEGHDGVMNRIVELIRQVIEASGLARSVFEGIGVGVPGIVDLDRGLTLFLHNLPGNWPQVPLSQRIACWDYRRSRLGTSAHYPRMRREAYIIRAIPNS